MLGLLAASSMYAWKRIIRGESQIKMSQKVEKVQKGGGGVSDENQNIHNSKFGLFDKRGGGAQMFRFFPNANVDFKCFSCTKNKLVLK